MPNRNFNDGQEVVFEDMNAIPIALQREIYDRVIFEMIQRKTDAFFADSFLVEFATPTSVTVRSGTGFQNDVSLSSPEPIKRMLFKPSQTSHNITAPDASLDRIDILVVNHAIADELNATRKFKDAITDIVSDETLVIQRDWLAEIEIVAGSPNASPVAPATPTGKIKISTFLVKTVTGISGAGDVTDNRVLLPVGGTTLVDTLAAVRLTQNTESELQALILEIDNFIKFGHFEFTDFDNLGADPASPAAGRLRMYVKNGVAFLKDNSAVVVPLGSGGGGGGLSWYEPDGSAPVLVEENGQEVYLFEKDGDSQINLDLKVPQSFVAGRQIFLFISQYSPDAGILTQLMGSTTTLVRKNNDSVGDVTNQEVSTNTEIANTNKVDKLLEVALDLTDEFGAINSVVVQPGDLLKVNLTRTGGTDTNAIRLIGPATEPKFG